MGEPPPFQSAWFKQTSSSVSCRCSPVDSDTGDQAASTPTLINKSHSCYTQTVVASAHSSSGEVGVHMQEMVTERLAGMFAQLSWLFSPHPQVSQCSPGPHPSTVTQHTPKGRDEPAREVFPNRPPCTSCWAETKLNPSRALSRSAGQGGAMTPKRRGHKGVNEPLPPEQDGGEKAFPPHLTARTPLHTHYSHPTTPTHPCSPLRQPH